jgi:preprotein translocase subunit SecE
LLVALGVWGYYWLADSPLILRILAVIAGILAGGAVAWWSEPGKQFAVFAGESLEEVKKVVWPTRKETVQTTAAVFAFVVVMAVFLWLTDKTLEWALYELILGWKKT